MRLTGISYKSEARAKELLYAPTHQTPYTGWVKSMYGNGKIRSLSLYQYKDGKLDGLSTGWWKNAQKEFRKKLQGRQDRRALDSVVLDWPEGVGKKLQGRQSAWAFDSVVEEWPEEERSKLGRTESGMASELVVREWAEVVGRVVQGWQANRRCQVISSLTLLPLKAHNLLV